MRIPAKYDCELCRQQGKKSTFDRGMANDYILHLLDHWVLKDPFAESEARGLLVSHIRSELIDMVRTLEEMNLNSKSGTLFAALIKRLCAITSKVDEL